MQKKYYITESQEFYVHQIKIEYVINQICINTNLLNNKLII